MWLQLREFLTRYALGFQRLPWQIRLALGSGAAVTSIAVVAATVLVFSSLPSRDAVQALRVMSQASVFYDETNAPVFMLAKEHRIEVPLASISPKLVHAVVAIEDRKFFDHEGFDPARILGSALAVVRAGKAVQGGSTITQQLARQSLGREKTLRRKLRELLLAIEIERTLTKEEILELYLNKVYFGDRLYGAEAASRGYFAKPASELTIGEAALLAGLLQAPSAYAPTVDLEKAQARRSVVLRAMVETEAISQGEYEQAEREPVTVRDSLRVREVNGLYFKEEVRRQLVQLFGPERVLDGGLRVYTTLDLPTQRAAEETVAKSLRALDRKPAVARASYGGATDSDGSDDLQTALIALDPRTGAVRSLVGGRDFDQSPFNRATQARRQPGSAFKPFVYAASLEAGKRPNDYIDRLDEPLRLPEEDWTPDDEHVESSSLSLRDALKTSSNRAAVRLLDEVGLERTMVTARAFGFDDLPHVPSIALGSGEVTLQGISAAFTAFANGGLVSRPFLIRRVTDHRGAVLFEWNEPARRALTPENAYRMADMLADVIDHGTAWTARQQGFRLAAAGKTGTTNEFRDAWFIGFTPTLLAGVWVGYDQPRTIRANGYASDVAVPIWTEFMKAATRGQKSQWLIPPPGIARSENLRNVARLEDPPEKRGFWARLFGLGRDEKPRARVKEDLQENRRR
jgi:1A family penicillin-binding protein